MAIVRIVCPIIPKSYINSRSFFRAFHDFKVTFVLEIVNILTILAVQRLKTWPETSACSVIYIVFWVPNSAT